MSLRFVTRKLKTQTLGDDDGDVQSDNTRVSKEDNKAGQDSQNKDENVVSLFQIH